jgi:hypothetical protein
MKLDAKNSIVQIKVRFGCDSASHVSNSFWFHNFNHAPLRQESAIIIWSNNEGSEFICARNPFILALKLRVLQFNPCRAIIFYRIKTAKCSVESNAKRRRFDRPTLHLGTS